MPWRRCILDLPAHPRVRKSGEDPQTRIDEILKHHPTAKEEAEQYHKNFQKYGYKTWYDWSIAKWGTKWNSIGDTGSISLVEVNSKASSTLISILPESMYSSSQKLIKKHRDLTFDFTYEEPGCCFQGCVEGSHGFVTKDKCWEYTPEEDEDFDDEE